MYWPPQLVTIRRRSVWRHPMTDGLRISEDLCLNCAKLPNCNLGSNLRRAEVDLHVKVMITECDEWQSRHAE